MSPVDLKAYIRSCGVMANPGSLETAELLMTTGLKDSGKDRHLKSHLVSKVLAALNVCAYRLKQYQGNTPWENVDAMLTDVDKLRHGPEWIIREIKIMDGETPRIQYLFMRPIISAIRKMLVNPAFKGRMKWAPERHYSNMWTSDS
jgi:hypothetical protein